MSAMTNTFETIMLNTMRNITAPAPSAVFLALFLSDPTESGSGGTEVSYGGYARQQVSLTAPATSGMVVKVENASEIVFPTPAGQAGRVTFGALMDAPTGGTMLVYTPLTNPIVLTSETSPRFALGEFSLTMSGSMFDPAFKVRMLNFLRGTTINGFLPFFSLFDGDPTADGAELSGVGYARLPLTFDTPSEQISGQMLTSNINAAQSNQAANNWGTWAFFVLMDAETGGNRIAFRQNSGGAYSMNNNAQVYLRPGDIRIALN